MWDAVSRLLFGARELDERFVAHRYRASRFALVCGLLVMLGWFAYDYAVLNRFDKDLFVTVLVMAAAKLAAMAYYRITH